MDVDSLVGFALPTGVAYDARMCLHENTECKSRECPERIAHMYQRMVDCGLIERCVSVTVVQATE